ncbi:AzlC family ABC transporter permease [Faecalicoccus pleomorphus]|uniref:Branched-chain amino acid transport protein azlC n=1 Tax=Faecalicoccus pleomorphus TaxID=1323 RepID=A0A380LMC9_9FIRM|nr:AzlC family ABC transporter permease [Faecalicoccus pleomorphus]MBM6808022.1 AzlC family ABC transporter permease [Faecalicoccus pleomorphus]SUO04423.1 Branched-chain amino acid transport protein azlC [Faecalicoccus pleomorphus]
MKTNVKMKALKCAFPHTIPIMTGFLFLGMSYGIYMHVSGFSFWYPMLMAMTIFAGSVEFVCVNFLLGAFNPLQAFIVTLILNARHIFYGISMLDRFKGMGWKKIYLIFGMCDETFSVNYTADIPKDVDSGWFMFFVTLLNQIYWVLGATLGGLFGSLIMFNTEGLDFVMTAMFVVIFLEQYLKDKNHLSSYIGLSVSLLMLIFFGADNFMIPAISGILVCLSVARKSMEEKEKDIV